jgi:hypothetical protein
MKLTKKKAVELSIKKWEWIVENNGKINYDKLFKDLPELEGLLAQCGLCQLYVKDICIEKWCEGCPIDIAERGNASHGCFAKDHPWNTWRKYGTKENAQAVLDLIKSIKV